MITHRKTRGFSLIELLIVLAILALVVTFGYPAYQDQIRKGRRTEGTEALLELAQAQERFFAENQTYTNNLTAAPTANPPGLGFAANPIPSVDQGYYNVRIAGGAAPPPGAVVPAGGCPIATCFVLVATPNAAVNPDQVNDGPLFLNSLGQRFRDANNNGTIDAGEDTWN